MTCVKNFFSSTGFARANVLGPEKMRDLLMFLTGEMPKE